MLALPMLKNAVFLFVYLTREEMGSCLSFCTTITVKLRSPLGCTESPITNLVGLYSPEGFRTGASLSNTVYYQPRNTPFLWVLTPLKKMWTSYPRLSTTEPQISELNNVFLLLLLRDDSLFYP